MSVEVVHERKECVIVPNGVVGRVSKGQQANSHTLIYHAVR